MHIKYIEKTHFWLILTSIMLILSSCCSQEEGKIPITTSSCDAREYYIKGRDLTENLQKQEAMEFFQKAIDLDSNFAMAYYGAATAQTNPEKLFEFLDKAISHSENVSEGEQLLIKAIQARLNKESHVEFNCYIKLISLYPKDERILYHLGNYYFSQHDFENAIINFKKVIEMNQNFAPVYNQLGYAYRFLEKFDVAEKTFKQYIRLIPDNPNPYDSYAELLLKMGEYEASLEQYRKAIKQDSNFVASYVGMATNLVYISDYYEARLIMEQFYNKAKTEEEKRRALVFTAISYVDEGDFDNAIRVLNSLAEKSQDQNQAISNATAHGIKSAIYFEIGLYDKSITEFKNAINIISNSHLPEKIKSNTRFDLLYRQALVNSRNNKFDLALQKAQKYLDEAEQKDDKNQIRNGYELFGRISMDRKQYKIAIENLLMSDLHNPYNLYLIGLAYEKINDAKNAKIYLEMVVNFNSILNLDYAFCRTKAKYKLADLQ